MRRALAGNVSAPHAVLEALAADADARVAQSAEVSQAYVRDHNGDDAALYPVLAERDTRGRAERGTRGRFGSNYSEMPNSSHRRDAARDWTGSRGDVSPGNKPIVFMSEDEMVEAASRSTLSDKDQNLLVVFGSEHVHMAMVCRDDLCEKAQVSLIVHGSERVREALATRSVLSKRVHV